MKIDVFQFLTDISYNKKNILSEDVESQYSPYIINRFLSMDVSTIMYANEMNLRPNISKRMQYDYYLHGIKKHKRYFKYLKSTKEKNLDIIKEYFNYSEKKAKEVVKLFSQQDLDAMATQLSKGGADGKAK